MRTFHLHRSILLLLPLLLTSGFASSQTGAVRNRFTFRETVWIETGRDLYVPGEDITFLAKIMEKDTYLPSRLSRFLRIELLDQTGKPLVRKNMESDDALFHGTLPLAPDLKSGWYFIRAYTNWMRNFPVGEFTIRPVKVINPADPPARATLPNRQGARQQVINQLPMTIEQTGTNLVISLGELNPNTGKQVRLLVHRSYTWYGFETATITGNRVKFTVPVSSLPNGLVQFSLLDDKQSVLARRLWYSGSPMTNALEVKVNADTLNFRMKATAQYHLKTEDPSDAPTSLLSIISLSPTQIQKDSLMPGLPGWSASGEVPSQPDQLTSWLENHSYPDDCILAFFPDGASRPADPETINRPPLGQAGLAYPPETSVGVMTGIVTDSLTNKGIPDIGVGLNVLNGNKFLASKTDSTGLFRFAFHQTYGDFDYILSFLTDSIPGLILQPFGTWDERPFQPDALPFNINPGEMAQARILNLNLQVARVYADSPPSVNPIAAPKPADALFFDPPERTIETDRYIELANIQEVIYEVVPDVWVRKNEGRACITVYNSKPFSRNFSTLVLLDGIPLPDQHELLELPPSRIKSIQVKNRLFIHGDYLFTGIVNFVSRNNDFAGLKLPAKSVTGSFTLPAPDEQKNVSGRIPGSPFIPVLNPVILERELIPDSVGSFEFQTGDLPGKYRIRIFGYGRSGFWCYGSCEFSVFPPIP